MEKLVLIIDKNEEGICIVPAGSVKLPVGCKEVDFETCGSCKGAGIVIKREFQGEQSGWV